MFNRKIYDKNVLKMIKKKKSIKSEDKKLKEIFSFQMTTKQKEELLKKAEQEQMPVSVYIRRILFPIKKED